MSATTIPIDPLPRDIDVNVIIARPQYEEASDLSLACFATPDVDFPPSNDRVRRYMSSAAVLDDTGWTPNDTGYWAQKAFFDQTVRPPYFAVGRIFEADVPAQLMGATITSYTGIKSVTDGSFAIDLTDQSGVVANVEVSGLNFSSITNLQSIVSVINTALADEGQSSSLAASIDYGGNLVLTDRTGGVAISYATNATSGSDVSALLNLTQNQGAQKWDAYTPTGLVGEIQNIALAARAGVFPVFAWAIDAKYRDTDEQRAFSDWAESQGWRAWALQCTNSPTAYNSADTTNIGYYCKTLGYKNTSVVYSDTPQQYPEIAYATAVLSVDYNQENSVKNAAFKDAAGITPSSLDVTKVGILESRRINMFVRVGNTARTYRYGMQSAESWWTDSFAGACNFRESLQVSVCNALYNREPSYTNTGMNIIQSAIAKPCSQFKKNGYLSDRDIQDDTNETGYTTLPAYSINPTPIYRATATEKATRTAPPFYVTVYEAGKINHVNIYTDIVN